MFNKVEILFYNFLNIMNANFLSGNGALESWTGFYFAVLLIFSVIVIVVGRHHV